MAKRGGARQYGQRDFNYVMRDYTRDYRGGGGMRDGGGGMRDGAGGLRDFGGGHRDYRDHDHGGQREYGRDRQRDYSGSSRDYGGGGGGYRRDYGGSRDHHGGHRDFGGPPPARDHGGGGGGTSREFSNPPRGEGGENLVIGGDSDPAVENFGNAAAADQTAASASKLVLYPSSKKPLMKNEKIVIQPILVRKQRYKECTLFEYTCRNDSVEQKPALQDILSLIELKSADDAGRKKILAEKPYLNFYSDQKGAMCMFREEIDEQLIQGDPNVAAVLAAASDMIPRLARTATEQKCLNNFITALTASESGSTTKNMAFKGYASKLTGDKEYLKASCFYFGAFDVQRGIRSLLEAKCLRDAVLAAKLRLAPTNELYREAHELWSIKFSNDRCFEAAAKSWISANDFAAAAEVLMKRDTPVALQVAVQLALKGDKKELALTTALRCISMSMYENAWNVGLSVIEMCPELEPWRYVIYLHEGLLYVCTTALAPLMIDAFQIDLKFFDDYVHNLNQENFVHSMWHLWTEKGRLDPDLANLQKMISLLNPTQCTLNMPSLKAILPSLAARLSMGLFYLPFDATKCLDLFGTSIELVSLFTDVANVVTKITNRFRNF